MKLIQSGPRDAKIVICGEAPGAKEDASGVPFSGGSGQLLNDMMSRCGMNRDDCFVTNVTHVRPPSNEFDWFLKPQVRPELIDGIIQLKEDLNAVQPNLIVAFGAKALQTIAGKDAHGNLRTIDKWRGSVLETKIVPGLKVISTYHPAYVLRIYDYKAVVEMDLRRAAEQAQFPEIRRITRELILNPEYDQALALEQEFLTAEWLSVDIECFKTEGGWQLACVGFADRANRVLVLPYDGDWRRSMIKRICESSVRKVAQNGTFDQTVLAENGIALVNFAWDTMLAQHTLYLECAGSDDEMSNVRGKKKATQPAIRKGLGFLTSVYTDVPFYKDDGKLWRQTNDLMTFWKYNGYDGLTTREIRDYQEKELAEANTTHAFYHSMALVEPLSKATGRGIAIDADKMSSLDKGYEVEEKRLQLKLNEEAGEEVNVKSPPQLIRLLYDKLKLPIQRHRETKQPTTDKDALAALGAISTNPVLRTILALRQTRDFRERYTSTKLDADGRMRCSFDIAGTRSTRLSSSESIWGSGTNLLNIPEEIRPMFVADPGKVFVYRDYSQAEARIVAYLSRCKGLIELFEDPSRDIHTENAARIFGRTLANVTSDERYLAKKVVHGSNYAMGEARLAQVVNEEADITGVRIDQTIARSLMSKYFLLYPEIREVFWRKVEDDLRWTRTLVNDFGCKRMFFGRWDDKLLREAYSWIPQSDIGYMGCEAIISCYHNIEKKIDGAHFVLNVYDSIMMQCWEKDAEEVAHEMERLMKIPLTIHGQTFLVPSDVKVGKNWGNRPKKHPEENPNGLVTLETWLTERKSAA